GVSQIPLPLKSIVRSKSIYVMISIPVFGMGLALIYFAYLEINLLSLFIYFILGLAMIVIGTQLFLLGIGREKTRFNEKLDVKKWEEPAIERSNIHSNETEKILEICPNCGAEIKTAGKFCGSCGKSF
ncbi:MAG: hypothetical protein ACE5PM_08615, partial [Candidatus Hydrothermarchaeales archaeon]